MVDATFPTYKLQVPSSVFFVSLLPLPFAKWNTRPDEADVGADDELRDDDGPLA